VKILVFTEGTMIMHCGGVGHTREEIVRQVQEKETTIHDWASYVPIGGAAAKLKAWQTGGAEIIYLTSRRKIDEIKNIERVLTRNGFPAGRLLFREKGQRYKDIAEAIAPDILIEDDCKSIGGVEQMTITHVKPEIKARILSIQVKEFGGIDHLPDEITALKSYKEQL
jgi:hypothetical protein